MRKETVKARRVTEGRNCEGRVEWEVEEILRKWKTKQNKEINIFLVGKRYRKNKVHDDLHKES